LLAQNSQIFAKPKPGLSPPPHGPVNYAYAKIENEAANKISLETINPYLGFWLPQIPQCSIHEPDIFLCLLTCFKNKHLQTEEISDISHC
jgi:hypothetical protein